MKIGYQGIKGSNSEEAAKRFAEKLHLKNVEYIPLISSKNVIEGLEQNQIDFGVLAIKNNYAGEVFETKKALEESKEKFECIDKLELEIHHSIFKKSKNVKDKDLEIIASHKQALRQTAEFRKKNLPNLKEQEVEDTALSAKYLADNTLNEKVAIIAKTSTGLMYGLELMYENVEDLKGNATEFGIYRRLRGSLL